MIHIVKKRPNGMAVEWPFAKMKIGEWVKWPVYTTLRQAAGRYEQKHPGWYFKGYQAEWSQGGHTWPGTVVRISAAEYKKRRRLK